MNPAPPSRDALVSAIGHLSGAPVTRRALMSQMSGAALAMILSGALIDAASAAPGDESRPGPGTVETLPDGLRIERQCFQILVRQIDTELIGLEVAPIDDPDSPIYSSTHTGVLTDELIDQISGIGQLDLRHSDVNRFNAVLRSIGNITPLGPFLRPALEVIGLIVALILVDVALHILIPGFTPP